MRNSAIDELFGFLHWRSLAFLVLTGAMACALAAGPAASVRRVNFTQALLQRDGLGKQLRRECGHGPLIRLLSVGYGKLTGDGAEQAVVEASTCMMGNGGADIVEVFRLQRGGRLASLALDDSTQASDLYAGQRRTPRLEVRDGKLVRWFVIDGGESSAKALRREITYRWAGDRFVAAEVNDVAQ